MTREEFVELAKAMRELGATEVSADGFSARFAPTNAPKLPVHVQSSGDDHAPISESGERAMYRMEVKRRLNG